MGRLARGMRRIGALSWADRGRAVEAVFLLAVASAAIRLLPFRWVVRAAGGLLRRPRPDWPDDLVARVTRIVDACADRVPWRAVCFQRGLAAHIMLRRRGIPSVLCYGVAQSEALGLNAHVWVNVGGQVAIGAAGLAGHVCLARFPADVSG